MSFRAFSTVFQKQAPTQVNKTRPRDISRQDFTDINKQHPASQQFTTGLGPQQPLAEQTLKERGRLAKSVVTTGRHMTSRVTHRLETFLLPILQAFPQRAEAEGKAGGKGGSQLWQCDSMYQPTAARHTAGWMWTTVQCNRRW